MELKRAGSQPSKKGPAEWFTGTVRLDPLNAPPAPSRVSIDILHCGVCHSDLHTVRKRMGQYQLPVVPGHEIVGRVKVGTVMSRVQGRRHRRRRLHGRQLPALRAPADGPGAVLRERLRPAPITARKCIPAA
jgi:hypothetical protein